MQPRTRMDRMPARKQNNSRAIGTEAVGTAVGIMGPLQCVLTCGPHVRESGYSRSQSHGGFQNAHLLINSWGESCFSSNLRPQGSRGGIWWKQLARETSPERARGGTPSLRPVVDSGGLVWWRGDFISALLFRRQKKSYHWFQKVSSNVLNNHPELFLTSWSEACGWVWKLHKNLCKCHRNAEPLSTRCC